MVHFEQLSYETAEEIGVDDFALRICVNTSSLSSDINVTVSTSSGTATGRELIYKFQFQ